MKIDFVMWGLSLLFVGVVITFFGFLGSAFWSANGSKIMNIDLSAGLDISGGTGMAPVARFVKCFRALDNQLDAFDKMDYSHKRNGKPLLSWRVVLLPFMVYALLNILPVLSQYLGAPNIRYSLFSIKLTILFI